MTAEAQRQSSWFQRFLLPGLAFKAVVIGGGYATGRELAEFFLGSGPAGGLLGMADLEHSPRNNRARHRPQ